MPVLNNLLENREMALEDGRFLLPKKRYDSLTEEQRQLSSLVPVHPNFRVIALGALSPAARRVGSYCRAPWSAAAAVCCRRRLSGCHSIARRLRC